MRAHVGDDAMRGDAFVEVARIRFDARERCSEIGLLQSLAEFEVAKKNAAALRPRLQFLERLRIVQHAFEKWTDRESCIGQFSRRLDEVAPFQFAVAFVSKHQSRDRAGNADRFVAVGRCALDDVAVRVEVHVARRTEWRAFAIVDRFGRAVQLANEHESAAAEVAGGGPCDGECEGDGDCSVDGVAPFLHHVDTDARRDLARRRHHGVIPDDGIARRRRRSGGEEKKGNELPHSREGYTARLFSYASGSRLYCSTFFTTSSIVLLLAMIARTLARATPSKS